MKSVFFFLLLAVWVAFVLPAFAQDGSAKLIGTWNLISYEDRSEKGMVTHPWGEHPYGLLIYDETGHMAIQIQRTPVVKLKTPPGKQLTLTDKQKLLDAYTAYFGRYTVDWTKMTITHHVEGNLFPVHIGTDAEKSFELTADRLILKAVWMDGGMRWSGVRVFEKLTKK